MDVVQPTIHQEYQLETLLYLQLFSGSTSTNITLLQLPTCGMQRLCELPLTIDGDRRADSPGHSAKYDSYGVINLHINQALYINDKKLKI